MAYYDTLLIYDVVILVSFLKCYRCILIHITLWPTMFTPIELYIANEFCR